MSSQHSIQSIFHDRRRVKKTITISFYVLVIAFLAYYIKKTDFSQLQDLSINWLYILIASVFGVLSRYSGAFIWLQILRNLGAKNLKNIRLLIYVYAKSWLGRYIPGTAPWILGKIYFVSQQGISKKKLAVSSLLEGGLKIVVTMAIAILLLIFDPRFSVLPIGIRTLMVGGFVACVVALLPPVFNFIVAFAYKLTRRRELEDEHLVNRKTILHGTAAYTVNALINGLALFFIAKAVYPELGFANMTFVMGASSLAASISMLAIFIPSGLGVREGIQLLLLSVIMPTEFALIVVVVTRLWSVCMDFLFLCLSRIFYKSSTT